VRLKLLSENTAKFISRALEESSSIDSCLLLLKLASRWFSVTRLSVHSCLCALGSLYYPDFVDLIVSDSILLSG
jgi:hypothetical protein